MNVAAVSGGATASEGREAGFTERLRSGFESFKEQAVDCTAGLLSGVGPVDLKAPYGNDYTRALCKAVGAAGGLVGDAALGAKGVATASTGAALSATGVGVVAGAPAIALGAAEVTAATAGSVLHANNFSSATTEMRSANNRGSGAKGKQEKEQVRTHASPERARNQTLEEVGDLGHGRQPTKGTLHDAEGRINGFQSADGKRGFRIDFDPEKGAHYNWYDWSKGNKGSGGRWGAEYFPATKEQYLQMLKGLER
jgi:hypothetical protein